MEERMTARDGWKHCYSAVRKANVHYKTAREYATPIGEIETAAYFFMLASKMIEEADTSHQSTGSVFAHISPEGYMFTVYTRDIETGLSNRHAFKFRFGDNTPENNDARNNRKQWQQFAQLLEEKAEADRKRAHVFDIVATVSDEAIAHIYNGAIVWDVWDKRGR